MATRNTTLRYKT